MKNQQGDKKFESSLPRLILVRCITGVVFLIVARFAFADSNWAYFERFNGDPGGPSQILLPSEMDYVVTHRTHPKEHFTKNFIHYEADHGPDCAGPDPDSAGLTSHLVYTDQTSNGDKPDESFFICKNHMMSSMGHVEAYSVSAFWPKQEFNFSDGGTLMFDVNVNEGHRQRHWWEIMIVPRDQLKVGAGPEWAAIDETYPEDRIVLQFRELIRHIKVGSGATPPEGWQVQERQFATWDWAYWGSLYPNDPALQDRRIRRTMKVKIEDDQIAWGIKTDAGNFDWFYVDVPGGLPFNQGLVVFKTHAYTPNKDGNFEHFTFHWDNLQFDGPVTGKYQSFAADDVVYLQSNGNRQVGESQTVSIDLPEQTSNPVLFGQVHNPKSGQVLLSVNGRPSISVHPYEYDRSNCFSRDWKSFQLPLNKDWLIPGVNTFQWTIGPRPNCSGYVETDWDGFSVKFLQIQSDLE